MKKDSVSFAVTIVLGLGLVLVGVTALVAPKFASTMFGVTVEDSRALVYVYATGLRDVVIGGLLAALALLGAGRRILGMSLIILALIPVGDAIIILLTARERNTMALSVHLLSAIAFVILGLWFRRDS